MKRAALILVLACARNPERAYLVLESGEMVVPASIEATPAGVVLEATETAGRLVLALALGEAREVRLSVPGACLLVVPLAALRPGQTEHRALTPAFTFTAPAAAGYDAPVSVTAAPGCAEAGAISWRQIAGPPLRDFKIEGRRLMGRTASREALLGTLPWGVVPVSARASGAVTLEARWGGGRRTIMLAAADRSRGLPNTPLGARLLLGGAGWRVVTAPPGGQAAIEPQQGVATLLPDAAGLWRLEDGEQRPLVVHAGRYDETLLDCGRSGCHAEETRAAAASPMTAAFARLLAARPPDPSCAVACHTTGDAGISDGGFSDLARSLGTVHLGRWEDLPQPLRRAGGVGCLACHGPGAIPAPSARWSILRAGVCATCHDAPPRYGHVAAWQSTRMAVADRDPRAREGACARCHTSWGFLAATKAPDRRPPDEAGPLGIACAACHAVHQTGATVPGLLRKVETPFPLPAGGERSAICLPCHAPGADRPYASAAALWLGRGGLDPQTGAALPGGAPHAAMPGGCLACHAGAPPGLERGRGHGFRAAREGCRRCHRPEMIEASFAAGAALRESAAGILARVGAATAGPHHPGARPDRATLLGRAVWNALLVLEDGAAAAHNPVYARALIASAESALARAHR
jgi:hypothetical protein